MNKHLKKGLFLFLTVIAAVFGKVNAQLPWASGAPNQLLLNEPVDIHEDFRNFANNYFLADELASFDPATGKGTVKWQRAAWRTNQAFSNMLARIEAIGGNEFPQQEYEINPVLPFTIEFSGPRTIRLRMKTGTETLQDEESLMLADGFAPKDNSWQYSKIDGGHKYIGVGGSVIIREKPWKVEFFDPQGKRVTKTNHANDNRGTYTPVLPFSFRAPLVRLFAQSSCSV
jgi:alpha-D-xyloside xylohydrolase